MPNRRLACGLSRLGSIGLVSHCGHWMGDTSVITPDGWSDAVSTLGAALEQSHSSLLYVDLPAKTNLLSSVLSSSESAAAALTTLHRTSRTVTARHALQTLQPRRPATTNDNNNARNHHHRDRNAAGGLLFFPWPFGHTFCNKLLVRTWIAP